MDANTLMLIFNCLIGFIIVSGLLVGLMRGFKKTTYKVITTILFYGILLLTIDQVAVAIVDAPLIEALYKTSLASSLPPYLEGCSTLKEACVAFLLENGIESTEVVPVAMSLAVVIAKLVYLVLYFIPIALVYWLLTSIIWLIIRPLFGSKYKKIKNNDGSISKRKKKKHRLLGGVMGALKKVPQAALVIIMTTGVVSMIPQIDASKEPYQNVSADIESDALMEFVEKYNLGEYVKFVEMYRNSAYVKVLGGLDVKDNSIGTQVFKKLTNGVYEDYKLDFQSEMALMLNTGIKVLNVTDGANDINSLSVIQQKQLMDILKDTTKSELIMSLIPMGVGIALSLDMVKQQIPEGLEIDASLFNNVNWSSDIVNLADAAKELIDISNGFQNIQNIDYLHMDTKHVQTLTQMLSNIGVFLNVVPALVDYALNLDSVKEALGDLTVDLEKIVWSDEIINIGDIYTDFAAIGLESFEDIFGQFQNFTDTQFDSTQTLISSVFESEFISQVFPATFNIMMDKQPTNIQQLFDNVTVNSWENEFLTLVDLAREVVHKGGTLDKVDLSLVKNVQVDTILKSDLLANGMVQIFATSGTEGSVGNDLGLNNYLYVPKAFSDTTPTSSWFDKEEAGVKTPGELRKILTSVQNIILTIPEGELDFSKLPNYILEIDDKYLDSSTNPNDSIFNSEILRASISNFVTTDETIKNNVAIPDNSDTVEQVDDIKVIKETELENMVKGIKALGITDFSNLGNINGDLIANLNEPYVKPKPGEAVDPNAPKNIDVLLKSNIVKLTVSNVLNDMDTTSEAFTVPSVAKEAKKVMATNGLEYEQIKTEEFKNIVSAANVPAIQDALQDISNPNLDPTILKELDDAQVDVILKSSIINFNLTTQIENFKTTGVLSYPSDTDIINADGLINSREVKAVVATIKNLNITDFNDMSQVTEKVNLLIKNAETTPDYTNLDKMLESKILSATLTSKVQELLGEIPNEAYVEGTKIYLNKNEVHSVVLGVVLLGDKISTTVPLTDIYRLNNTGKLQKVLDSWILKSQLSDALIKVGSTYLVMPEAIITVTKGETKDFTYIDTDELSVLIKSMEVLGFTNDSALNVTPQFLFTLLDEVDGVAPIDTLLSSEIMHATLSKAVIDQSGNAKLLTMPQEVIMTKTGTDHISNAPIKYISPVEIKSLIGSLKAVTPVGVDDFNNIPLEPSVLFNLVDGVNNENLKGVLKSKILHASLTNKMLESSTLVIPDDIRVISEDGVDLDNNKVKYINVDEIGHIIYGFKLLNPDLTAEGSLPIDITYFASMEKPQLELIFKSIILRATITHTAKLDNPVNFVVPSEVLEKFGTDKAITASEIANLVYALGPNGLGLDDFAKNDISANLILSLDDIKLGTIFNSKIFLASTTDILKNASSKPNALLVIPDGSYMASDKVYIKSGEIINLIKLVKLLGNNPTSFDDLKFYPSNLKGATLIPDTDGLIIHATLSNAILSSNGFVVTVESKDVASNLISKAEIETLFEVIANLTSNPELGGFTMDDAAITYFSENPALLKSSKILIATFSKTVEAFDDPIINGIVGANTHEVALLGKVGTVKVLNDNIIDSVLDALTSHK